MDLDDDLNGDGDTDDYNEPLPQGIDDSSQPGDAEADGIWHFGASDKYPRLKVDFDGDGNATVAEFGKQLSVPASPPNLNATAASATQVNLTWTAPTDNEGNPITGYTLEYSEDNNTWTALSYTGTAVPTTAAPYEHTSLNAGTTYYYRVAALSNSLTSNYAQTNITTPTLPDPPSNLHAEATSGDAIVLSWNAHFYAAGSEPTGYVIESSTDDTNFTLLTTTDDATLRYEHTGLQPGERHYYQIATTNAAGTSTPSASVSARTHYFPNAPTNLQVVAVTDTEIDLRWNAPYYNGGSPITSYKIDISATGNDGDWSLLEANISSYTHSYTHRNLIPGTVYHYRTVAINSVGESSPSAVASATTSSSGSGSPTSPGAPINLRATPLDDARIQLQWEAPYSGGSPITDYRIDTLSSDTWGTLVGNTRNTALSYTHTGVEPGRRYYYRVSAINDIGTSTPSSPASATTEAVPPTPTASVPAAPTSLTAVAVSFEQIDLSWAAPTHTGGSPITGYSIDTLSSDTWGTLVDNTGSTALSYTHTGVEPGRRYYYRVVAINDVGTSTPSSPASATTEAVPPTPTASVPAAPTSLTAVAVSFGQIDLSWAAPTHRGGSPITGYSIDTLSSDTWRTLVDNTGSTALSYTHTGVEPGRRYYYRVAAINDVGTSTPSSPASATTEAVSPTPTASVPQRCPHELNGCSSEL